MFSPFKTFFDIINIRQEKPWLPEAKLQVWRNVALHLKPNYQDHISIILEYDPGNEKLSMT